VAQQRASRRRALRRRISRAVRPFLLRAAGIVQGARQLTLCANRVKARFERDRHSMRGLLMAFLAFSAPSHDVEHRAGRFGASVRSRKTPFLVKKTGKTTTKTV